MKCICDRTSGRYPSLAKNPDEHWLSCPMAGPEVCPDDCANNASEHVHVHRTLLRARDYDFPIVRGVAPNQEHVYCSDCGELLTQRHQCKTPRGGFEFL